MSGKIGNTKSRVVIAGAGPAGSSLAIRLTRSGFDVTLIEREKFPRHKLCGEFISPECLEHFEQLGLGGELLSAGGEKIFETRFYDRRGRSFAVPSGLFGAGGFAISLSRYEMDRCLMEGARAAGVAVLEETRATDVVTEGGRITNIVADHDGKRTRIDADLFVDATGRSTALSKLVARKFPALRSMAAKQKPAAVAFKTHLAGARVAPGTCEIFSFPGGYGGITMVEGGLANLCFIVKAAEARRAGANAEDLVRKLVSRNERAAWCLADSKPVREWLAVSVNSFGRAPQTTAENLFSAGDAAAFIDPFTGSGMLMALEGAALLAEAFADGWEHPATLRREYQAAFDQAFSRRLRICTALRRLAFLPVLPSLAIAFFGVSRRSRNLIAASTRPA